MAGVRGRSGRPKKGGRVYYLGRIRFESGVDPPELKTVLEAIEAARGQKRRDIIKAALLSGAGPARAEAEAVESSVAAETVDNIFADF